MKNKCLPKNSPKKCCHSNNQYESLVLPLISHLEEQGVVFHYETIVKNIIISENENKEKNCKKNHFSKKE
ncbi:oleate hydratase [Spiroplasma endosymbiont of Dactylopius coccus]